MHTTVIALYVEPRKDDKEQLDEIEDILGLFMETMGVENFDKLFAVMKDGRLFKLHDYKYGHVHPLEEGMGNFAATRMIAWKLLGGQLSCYIPPYLTDDELFKLVRENGDALISSKGDNIRTWRNRIKTFAHFLETDVHPPFSREAMYDDIHYPALTDERDLSKINCYAVVDIW